MNLKEAQELSVSGVALLGLDVIWAKGGDRPYGFVKNGYVPMENGKRLAESDDWHPLHRLRKKDD